MHAIRRELGDRCLSLSRFVSTLDCRCSARSPRTSSKVSKPEFCATMHEICRQSASIDPNIKPHKIREGSFSGRQDGNDSVANEVEKLLGRTADGLLAEDRREALVLLSELLQSNEQVRPFR